MKRIKRQKRYRFPQDKERPSPKVDWHVSPFISQNSPFVQEETNKAAGSRYVEFNEAEDLNRDERLVDNIQRVLQQEGFLLTILDNIQVMANSGVITLEGIVFSEQEKIMVEEKAAVFVGLKNINNNLEVISMN